MSAQTFRQQAALAKIIAARADSDELLSIPATRIAWMECGVVIALANIVAWGFVYAAAMGWLP
jgi:hypothetical protein